MAIKYVQLASTLRTDIRAGMFQSTGKLPTEMQLASQYSVSRQTVRQALALLAQEGLIEKRQGSGSRILDSAAQMSDSNIAIVTSYINDYIFPALLQNVQSELDRYHYSTLVYSTANQISREREILKTILERPVRGLLVEGVKTALPNPNLDLYERIQTMGIPIVFLHGGYPSLDAVCISDDNESGGYQAVEYLMSKGHTKIGGIFKSDDIQGHQRYYGFLSALRDANLPFPDRQLLWYNTVDRYALLELGQREWLQHFVETTCKEVTALVCYNDEIAHPLIQLLQSNGIRVPEDIAVVSFDNSYYSDMGSVHITSYAHNPGHLGRLAAQSLVNLIHNRPAQSQTVPWHLIEKQSS